jgi:antitoxin (DNA-binding transcriptional repressor) of toxin-antitoxin stability system
MNVANISYTRNHLSKLLARVRDGETILIVDRNRPVARLEPPPSRATKSPDWGKDLIRRGLIRSGGSPLDRARFHAMALPSPKHGADILAALKADREEGR